MSYVRDEVINRLPLPTRLQPTRGAYYRNTNRVIEWLASKAKTDRRHAWARAIILSPSISDLLHAINLIHDTGETVPKKILDYCQSAVRGRTIIWQYYSGLLASHPELHESNDGHLYFIQTLKTIGDILKQAYINHKQRLITQAQIDAQSGLLNFEDPDQWSDDEFEDVEDTNTQGTLLQVEEKLLLNDDPLDNIVVLVSDLDKFFAVDDALANVYEQVAAGEVGHPRALWGILMVAQTFSRAFPGAGGMSNRDWHDHLLLQCRCFIQYFCREGEEQLSQQPWNYLRAKEIIGAHLSWDTPEPATEHQVFLLKNIGRLLNLLSLSVSTRTLIDELMEQKNSLRKGRRLHQLPAALKALCNDDNVNIFADPVGCSAKLIAAAAAVALEGDNSGSSLRDTKWDPRLHFESMAVWIRELIDRDNAVNPMSFLALEKLTLESYQLSSLKEDSPDTAKSRNNAQNFAVECIKSMKGAFSHAESAVIRTPAHHMCWNKIELYAGLASQDIYSKSPFTLAGPLAYINYIAVRTAQDFLNDVPFGAILHLYQAMRSLGGLQSIQLLDTLSTMLSKEFGLNIEDLKFVEGFKRYVTSFGTHQGSNGTTSDVRRPIRFENISIACAFARSAETAEDSLYMKITGETDVKAAKSRWREIVDEAGVDETVLLLQKLMPALKQEFEGQFPVMIVDWFKVWVALANVFTQLGARAKHLPGFTTQNYKTTVCFMLHTILELETKHTTTQETPMQKGDKEIIATLAFRLSQFDDLASYFWKNI